MKTLKELQCQRVVTWSLVVMFSFLQIVPTGWAAARPVEDLQSRGVSASVDALANAPAAAKPALLPQNAVGFVDSTAFQLNDNPLSPAQKPLVSNDPIVITVPIPKPIVIMPPEIPEPTPVVRPEVAAVKTDLMKNLGIDSKQLEAWLKAGLITIGYDKAKQTVTVSFSEQLRSQYDSSKNVNLFDPTGASGLPKSIEYHVSLFYGGYCAVGKECVSGPIAAQLDSANITNWDGTLGKAQYSKGQLQQVNWYRSPRKDEPVLMISCQEGAFACGMRLDRTVTYSSIVGIPENPGRARILATVVYTDGRAIPKLEFEIGQREDGKDHILKVREYDPSGKLRVTSEFKYKVELIIINCASGATCVQPPTVVHLDSIVRTDASGKLLSTIRNIRKNSIVRDDFNAVKTTAMPPIYLANYTGDVVLANGQTRSVGFNDLSDLLEQSRKFEQERKLPPAVQAYIDALKKQLGTGFSVTATLQKDGTYLISVADAKAYVLAPTTGLHQMSFTLLELSKCTTTGTTGSCISAGYSVDPKSLQAVYYGKSGDIKVDASLLFGGMKLLEVGIPETADIRALGRMSQITVTSVDAKGAIHFTKDGIDYKTYRNANGKVVLEKEIPAAVQAYIDALKKQLGSGFLVTATLQKDGTYLVHVGRVNTCPQGAVCAAMIKLGSFSSLEFSLSKAGVLNRDSIKAYYAGMVADGKLLFAALEKLYPRIQCLGGGCVDQPEWLLGWDLKALQAMTRITVTSVDAKGAIHFSLDKVNYKVSRDANGKVLLEKETQCLPEILAQAKQFLGAGVVSGVILSAVSPFEIQGAGVTTNFYDAAGKFMGSYVTNPSLGPNGNKPTWRDAAGRMVGWISETYGSDGKLVSRTVGKYEYDAKGNLSGWVGEDYGPDGKLVNRRINKCEYNESGKRIKLEQLKYNAAGKLEYSNIVEYDNNGNLVRQTFTEYQYPADGSSFVRMTQYEGSTVKVNLAFRVSKDGVLDRDSITAYYSGRKVDGKLLFVGLEQLYPMPEYTPCIGTGCVVRPISSVNWEVLKAMTRINVSAVDSTGAIHFSLDKVNYKVSRDANGVVRLVEERAVSAHLLAQARSILGDSVAQGYYRTVPEGMRIEGGQESYYDSNGKLVGSHQWDPTRGMDQWLKVDANGQLVEVTRACLTSGPGCNDEPSVTEIF